MIASLYPHRRIHLVASASSHPPRRTRLVASASSHSTAPARRLPPACFAVAPPTRVRVLRACDETADPSPKKLKRMGVGGVAMPSTIKHSAYLGKPSGLGQMLLTAFEEIAPDTALLVIPNGESVARRVQALRNIGFDRAEALQDALGVPAAREGASGEGAVQEGATGEDAREGPSSRPRQRARAGETLQGEMVGRRETLASAFARREADVPLLVTTEHSARGIDFKGIDAVFMVGLPSRVDSYVHVAGRTAREGRKGRAVCLLTQQEETERLREFGSTLGIQIETVDLRFL